MVYFEKSKLPIDENNIVNCNFKNEEIKGVDKMNEESIVNDGCVMTLEMRFIAPKLLYKLFSNRSSAIQKFLEKRLLTETLVRFRHVVERDLNH